VIVNFTGWANGEPDRRLHVAVVDADQVVRHGLAVLLEQDARLHIMNPVAGVADLYELGLHFDVCVIDISGLSGSDEITELFHSVPSVACTAARDWRPWVAAWVCGARGVVGRDVPSVPMADAAWDAVHRPHDVQPQLARALISGITECDLAPPSDLIEVLGRVAEGRRVSSALAASGIPESSYESDMRHLRVLYERSGLGTMKAAAQSSENGHTFEPSSLPPEALGLTSRVREVLRFYADGYSYPEIAKLLQISETTVKTHVLTALDRFGITSNRPAEVRLLFAMYISGRHRCPDLVRQRLDRIRDGL
jgi:DNA-binding NarL/FixJ family response regulator